MSSTESQENAPLVRWPSAEWRAEFHKQVTNTMLDAATGSATNAIARLGRHDVQVDLTAEDLVQDILTATLDGTLAWRPEKVPLLGHVRDVIRYRCRHTYRRSHSTDPVPEVALDALGEDDALWTDVEDALASEVVACSDADLADLARRLVAEITRFRKGDRAVLAVLRAMVQGDTTDAELVEATGLNPHALHDPKRRLRRTARSVSPDLLAEIRAALGISTDRRVQRRDLPDPAAKAPTTTATRVARVRRVAAARRSASDVPTTDACERIANAPKRISTR